MDSTSDTGHMPRMMDIASLPILQQHSLSGWLMLLAVAGIIAFAWTRILKYITEG